MKRPLLFFLLVMMLAWVVTARYYRLQEFRRHDPHDGQQLWATERAPSRRALRRAHEVQAKVHSAVQEARLEVHRALAEARDEVHQSLEEAHQELRCALDEATQEVRESAEDIPVPIVPGTRVVEALAQTPSLGERTPTSVPDQPGVRLGQTINVEAPGFPGLVERPPAPPSPPPVPPQQEPAVTVDHNDTHVLTGLRSATEERARSEVRKQLENDIADWLEPAGVPRSWRPPAHLVDSMILGTTVEPVVKDYGTVYEAKLRVDVSPRRRSIFTASYKSQLVHRRMVLLGGALGFILICLTAISGYIRADEATKGYYTNRLRLLAAGGVGAAAVLIYQMLT